MGVIEVILISIAISLDIFGVMLCKGSTINKVNINKLMKMSYIYNISIYSNDTWEPSCKYSYIKT